MTTFPLPTMGCTLDETGISAPPYADLLGNLKFEFQGIYGSDAYVEPDSQDGQLLAIFARAINDDNGGTIAAYQSFRPGFARGVGLSSVVKINGLKRATPSNSTADLTIVGQATQVITNGVAGDGTNRWVLPTPVTIPLSGSIVVTATCDAEGAITATAGSITKILTPTLGWQTVTNVADATPGAPVESDATLRRRQAASTGLPAQSPLQAVEAAILELAGVTRVQPYENDTDSTNGDGIPQHSIAMVVEGGDATQIASTILFKKSEGAATYGTTTENVPDFKGVPRAINFFRPTDKRIDVEISIHPLTGYTSTVGGKIVTNVAAYGAVYNIGDDVVIDWLNGPANLYSLPDANGEVALDPDTKTFKVALIRVRLHGGSFGTSDLTIAFNELAQIAAGDITLLIV